MSCLVEIGLAVLEKNFCYYLPLKKGKVLRLKKNWILLTQGCSMPSLVEIDPVVLENKPSMNFHYVAIISLWQRAWSFIGTNLNRHHLGMLYVKHGETWLGDSEEVNMWKRYGWILEQIFTMYFHYVAIISLWQS